MSQQQKNYKLHLHLTKKEVSTATRLRLCGNVPRQYYACWWCTNVFNRHLKTSHRSNLVKHQGMAGFIVEGFVTHALLQPAPHPLNASSNHHQLKAPLNSHCVHREASKNSYQSCPKHTSQASRYLSAFLRFPDGAFFDAPVTSLLTLATRVGESVFARTRARNRTVWTAKRDCRSRRKFERIGD